MGSPLHPWQAAQSRTACYSFAPPASLPSAFYILTPALRLLCFQQLPTINFCNSLLLITIRTAGGGWGHLPFHSSIFSVLQSFAYSSKSRMLLSPVLAADPQDRPVTPLLATLPKSSFITPLFATHPRPPAPVAVQPDRLPPFAARGSLDPLRSQLPRVKPLGYNPMLL